jgi:hypothetical protein
MVLTFYTVAKSQRLFEFLDSLASEDEGIKETARAFIRVWRRDKRPG